MSEATTITLVSLSSTGAPDTDTPAVSMDDFYPALVQCFGIIICGYVAGRLKIITNSETKGLGTFVGTFALPCLIFLSLVELNWRTVNWTFLLAILISKSIVFFAVIAVSLLIARPLNYGRAGLLAIFCTQSNDFAIGFPIVNALYKKVHPEYAAYLYLMAPISLAILNPVGYILMEITQKTEQKAKIDDGSLPVCPAAHQQSSEHCFFGEKTMVIFKTFKSIFFNPMILMTLLGVVGGVAFPDGLPEIVSGVLRVFGNSFSATALFLLGLKIVGQGTTLRGSGFLIPGILIIVKILVLPLVARQTVNIMQAGENFNETTELSTFGFLYGTFPAAPGAFVIATQYNTEVELIAKSMVACTFISAPLMFISAKMISLTNLNPADYLHELDEFSFDISVTGVVACIWVLVFLTLTKKVRRMPHRITGSLVLSQLFCCVGVILWSKLDHTHKWVMYVQFFMFNIGSYSSRLWTAILAISLLFLQCRSLCFVLKMWPYMIICAWGVPGIISGLLIAFDKNIFSGGKHNPSFQYGNAQAAISVFLLVMCFIVTVGCLVMHQRYKRRFEKYLTLARELSNPDSDQSHIIGASISTANLLSNAADQRSSITRRRHTSLSSSEDEEIVKADNETRCSNGVNGNEDCCSAKSNPTTVVDIEDLLNRGQSSKFDTQSHNPSNQFDDDGNFGGIRAGMCSPSFSCAGSSRQNCQAIIQQYEEQARRGLEPLEFPKEGDEHQTLKHTVLLIILLCSMFVSLAVSIWTLVMEGMSGIYLELSFLDAFLNFGQSLIVLAVFITDSSELLIPLGKYWTKMWYGANILTLPHWGSISPDTKHICEQFRNHHLENCKKDIATDKRWRIKVYHKVFYGTEFVNWLIEVGLAKDRLEGIHYAKHLVDGRVMRHINNVYHFEDRNLLYTFCNRI